MGAEASSSYKIFINFFVLLPGFELCAIFRRAMQAPAETSMKLGGPTSFFPKQCHIISILSRAVSEALYK